ncbi:MAG: ABC transporter substrate-binding protein [Ruminococcus sp.]|nr:ABC transporter substrate-binding protein [Ruminococcus sp.]
MKRFICLLLSAAVLAGAFSGCGAKAENVRQRVTVALWSDQLTEQYGKFLQDSFPQADITFYVATNSADFYRFKDERGDLPDILTLRRFSLRDVAELRDSLMDLSGTDVAAGFNSSYLRSYTYEDGTVNWLPTCAEVDGIIINKTMLEENGLSVPSDYGEFVSVCRALTEKGISPFGSNFAADFTCMEMLQGLSAAALSSYEGRQWRQKYESGEINELSEEVWLPAFEKMAEFTELTGVGEDNLEISHEDMLARFANGEMAMTRGTGDEAARYSKDGMELVMAPYFGETEEDNLYLTYPAFQIAANASAEEDEERKKLILDIISVMLSEDGLRRIAANQNMVSYSSDIGIDLSPQMGQVQEYAGDGRLYIRLASADMFSVSQKIVQGMIRGEYGNARQAFGAFNAALAEERPAAVTAAHIDEGYEYAFDPEHGSRAASAVMNSVREATGTELLIAPAACTAGNIAPGDYTEEQLGFLTMGETIGVVTCQMTGDQLYRYVDYVLTARGKRGSVINDSTLYTSSGFEMEIEKTDGGYKLIRLTADGGEIDRSRTYSVTAVISIVLMLDDAMEAAGVTEMSFFGTSFKQIIVGRLSSGTPLAEPTDYIKLT